MLLFMTGFAVLSVLCTVWCLGAKRPPLLTHKQPRDSVTARPMPVVVYSVLLHWREALRAQVIHVGQWLFRYRDSMSPLALVVTAAVSKPVFPLRSERVDHWLDGIGLMVALLYVRDFILRLRPDAATLKTNGLLTRTLNRNPL